MAAKTASVLMGWRKIGPEDAHLVGTRRATCAVTFMVLLQRLASCRVSVLRNVHCARSFHRQYSQSSLTPESPFDILFFGRDEFSCLVLNELHQAQGQRVQTQLNYIHRD